MTQDISAWTLYWSDNKLQSCIASQHPDDQTAINDIWSTFVSALAREAEILDLATGNGAVPAAMLQGEDSYHITAVDRADIDPLAFLTEPGPLQRVEFIGGIDVAKLPFADHRYDALSSQFGIEYADLEGVAKEVSRVLKPGGHYLFLMHHRDSDIVRPNELLIAEIENCLVNSGLIDSLRAFVNGTGSAAQLDEKGRQYLQTPGRKTKQISGQVFEAIAAIIQLAQHSNTKAAKISDAMITRLQAECSRLSQMQQASLELADVEQFIRQLREHGLQVNKPEVFRVGEGGEKALVGWLVAGSRPQ